MSKQKESAYNDSLHGRTPAQGGQRGVSAEYVKERRCEV
jgi:tRNA-dihydrouridine synthase